MEKDTNRTPDENRSDIKKPLSAMESQHRLLEIMEQETRQYKSMSEILTEKKSILLSNQPEKLARLDRQLLQLNKKANQLEAERLTTLSHLGLPEREIFSALGNVLDPVSSGQVQQIQYQLLNAAKEAHQLNQEVKELLHIAFRWLQDTVNIIVNAVIPEGQSYNQNGSKTDKQNKAGQVLSGSTVNHSA